MTWITESINVGSIKYIKVGDELWEDHIFAKSFRSYPYCSKQFSYIVKSTSHSKKNLIKHSKEVWNCNNMCTSTFLWSSMLLFGKKNKQWDTPFIKFMYYTTYHIVYLLHFEKRKHNKLLHMPYHSKQLSLNIRLRMQKKITYINTIST